ncbi:methylmalonyl-CoA mutase family protein [Lutibacter sp. A80]|uniref:methylmalonyl-CoA mutase family protein n=1 Tax=Lutibacter sp. A80 TaxID=2918453 RepID=UPI001F057E63|nr:methylmalonyl-CoA mutase family protein [Lutibacter sp. A80]UMB60215.1 methylmalonyl-CoA mutase family protein [Lutibacter sp. A80]
MSNFLINEFQTSSAAAWKQKIQFELDGADYNKTLLTNTTEGITIKPFYHADNFEKVVVPTSKAGFKICKTITITSETTANSEAQSAINKGITALLFKASKPFNTSLLFNNLLNNNIEFHFDLNFLSENFINKLCKALQAESFYLNIDPIGNLTKTGNWFKTSNNNFTLLENLLKKHPETFILSVDASTYQNAGANSIQQIAYALAHANEYLTIFGGEIGNKIQFKFATGSNYFFEIAKIRAFRYLYNLILSKYNTSAIAEIYTTPSLRNKTLYNTSINTFRLTSETVSAILGGANTIAIDTFISNFENSNKINKTQHQLLDGLQQFKNEKDAAKDTYYIEYLTKQLAEKALIIFKEIEKSGGFLNQLKAGTIQRKIAENAQKEQLDFNSKLLLDKTEKKLKPILKQNTEKKSQKTLIEPILQKRLSEKVEQKIRRHEA